MTRFRLDRRTMLKGLLGSALVTLALPPMEAMMNANGTAYAGGSAFPKRFGIWFWGNGVLPVQWVPDGDGPTWAVSPQLAPLAPVKDHVTVVSGTAVLTTNNSPHFSGPAGLFTGDEIRNDSFTRASIDQVIAAAVGAATRFPSLEVGVERSSHGLSYSGPNAVNPPETSPHALFDRLFGDGFRAPGEVTMADPRVALRRSVLDAVTAQAGRLRTGLGATDRARLDQHLTGVRELEMRLALLQQAPPNLRACARPAAPLADYPDVDGRAQMSAVSRVVSDLVAMALACDQTRVFTNMFSQPVNNVLFGHATAGHHQLTHDEPDAQPQVHAIVVSIIEELAYFIAALARVTEGDGTLLDHSVVLATTDVSFGRSHAIDNYPILLAGSAGGVLRQGIHYRSHGNENASRVALTLLRAMGVQAAEFGVGAGHTTVGLSGIEV